MLLRKVAPNASFDLPQSENLAQARALYYDFFAGIFLFELLESRAEIIMRQIEILQSNPLEDSNVADFGALKREIAANGITNIMREYQGAFLLPFTPYKKGDAMPRRRKGEIPTAPKTQIMLYLSHYTDGCLNASGLLKARQIVKKSSFRLNNAEFKESEEHLGFLLLFMRYLVLSAEARDKNLAQEAIKELILPLGNAVSEAILVRDDLRFYPCVARILRSFLEAESVCSAI